MSDQRSVNRVVDVAVVGAGTIGSMALWHLSRMTGEDGKPLRVLGIEQYGAVHTNGAFTGESRLFRVAAKEGRLFTPALKEARSQWLELGRLAGRDVLIPAGVLHVAPKDHEDLVVTREAIEEFGLPHRVFDAGELRQQFPQFYVEDEDQGILDEFGGAIRPESAVFAATRQALSNGAEILYNTAVSGIETSSSGVRLETSVGAIEAGKVIVAAGPWSALLLPALRKLTQVQNLTLTWFVPEDIGLFLPSRFPGFMRDLGDMHAFGAPSIDGYSVKVSPHLILPPVDDPTERPTVLDRETLRWMGEQAQRIFPSLDPEPVRWSIHPDSESIDHRPILDTIEDGRITIAAGMSGNGFKFAPVWGQAVAELALTGESTWQDEEYMLRHHERLVA